MTRRVGGTLHIEPEAPGECELCGVTAELRPYGPNEENVCFTCAMKDKAAAERAMSKRLAGVDLVTAPVEALAKARKQ